MSMSSLPHSDRAMGTYFQKLYEKLNDAKEADDPKNEAGRRVYRVSISKEIIKQTASKLKNRKSLERDGIRN